MIATELLADVAAIGPYFSVEVTTAPREGSLATWYDAPEVVAANARATCRALGTSDRRVGASILFQGFAARLWSPVLAVGLAHGVVIDLDPERTGLGESGLWTARPTSEPADDLADALDRVVVERHLAPFAAVLRESTGVSERILWGNAASALVGSYGVAVTARPEHADVTVVTSVLRTGRLAGTGEVGPTGRFRRHSCCQYYRVPGGGLCGDCVLR